MIMTDNGDRLAIRVTSASNPAATIKAIRAATGLSMAEIKTALMNRTPLVIAKLYGVDHDENEQRASSLFNDLENVGVEFEILLNGTIESRQSFLNLMEQWQNIGVQTDMMADLESGQPCIEALEWLQANSTTDVFQHTIGQIIAADGCKVDAETLNWARQQLNGA